MSSILQGWKFAPKSDHFLFKRIKHDGSNVEKTRETGFRGHLPMGGAQWSRWPWAGAGCSSSLVYVYGWVQSPWRTSCIHSLLSLVTTTSSWPCVGIKTDEKSRARTFWLSSYVLCFFFPTCRRKSRRCLTNRTTSAAYKWSCKTRLLNQAFPQPACVVLLSMNISNMTGDNERIWQNTYLLLVHVAHSLDESLAKGRKRPGHVCVKQMGTWFTTWILYWISIAWTFHTIKTQEIHWQKCLMLLHTRLWSDYCGAKWTTSHPTECKYEALLSFISIGWALNLIRFELQRLKRKNKF